MLKLITAWVGLPLFFLATGRSVAWWEAWIYCVVVLVPTTLFAGFMTRRDPAFMRRRMKWREKDPAQRRIVAWSAPILMAAFAIPGLDHRFDWSEPPVFTVLAALAAVLVAYLTIIRVFMENRWAGRTVETYADQRVVSTGPYAVVRHPMYVGSIVFSLATPVALGSWWGMLPALAYVPVVILRIRHEEELLLRELPGYGEYRRTVRYRLIPFVW